MEEAVDYCGGALINGVVEEAAEKATDYVKDDTWRRMIRNGGARRCGALADMARMILDGKEKLHDIIGWIADWMLGLFVQSRIARLFARHLAKRIPIPGVDENLTVAARGLQVTGIIICVINDDDLTRCACFVDVVLEEGKERVKKLITTAAIDWAQLHQLPVNG